MRYRELEKLGLGFGKIVRAEKPGFSVGKIVRTKKRGMGSRKRTQSEQLNRLTV